MENEHRTFIYNVNNMAHAHMFEIRNIQVLMSFDGYIWTDSYDEG